MSPKREEKSCTEAKNPDWMGDTGLVKMGFAWRVLAAGKGGGELSPDPHCDAWGQEARVKANPAPLQWNATLWIPSAEFGNRSHCGFVTRLFLHVNLWC